jgi:hypothetical protein
MNFIGSLGRASNFTLFVQYIFTYCNKDPGEVFFIANFEIDSMKVETGGTLYHFFSKKKKESRYSLPVLAHNKELSNV